MIVLDLLLFASHKEGTAAAVKLFLETPLLLNEDKISTL